MSASDVRVWTGTAWVSLKGPQGPAGPQATVKLGSVNTGAPGTNVVITDSDASPNSSEFNFTIPRGDPGQAATISVGSTSVGPAQVTNVGTSSAAILNFVVPQGPKGDPGSGVTIKGTLSGSATALPASPASGDMWILGNPIPTAAPNPASGTKAEGDGIVWNGTSWTNVGPIRGPQGLKGDTGTAATVTVSPTVTSLANGVTPTVTNTGTAQAAVLAFGIPQGAKGDPGRNAEVYNQVATPTPLGQGAIWIVP